MICIISILCFVLINKAHSEGYLTCLDCKNVADPQSCFIFERCGQDEICATREFRDRAGRLGYRMSCESEQVCGMLSLAQSSLTFGKREVAEDGPQALCHECCSSDECNAQLCNTTTSPKTSGYVTCLDCKEAADPQSCSTLARCGQDEICATREFRDRAGRLGYRMNCESKQVCGMLSLAQSSLTFGKREVAEDGPQTLCHECCSSDECNAQLCNGTTSPKTSEKNKDCGNFNWTFGNSCYLVGPGRLNWNDSKAYCKDRGSDLLVFNSKQEHDFIKTHLIELNATHVPYFWLGGVYSYVARGWEWLDGSQTHYTPWYVASNAHPDVNSGNWGALVFNPVRSSGSAKLLDGFTSDVYGFICEKRN